MKRKTTLCGTRTGRWWIIPPTQTVREGSPSWGLKGTNGITTARWQWGPSLTPSSRSRRTRPTGRAAGITVDMVLSDSDTVTLSADTGTPEVWGSVARTGTAVRRPFIRVEDPQLEIATDITDSEIP
ncbi:MAG: hypothetical protein KGJ90_00735 [Patescibacteria group bacterium]|nr:hypothetical protein [Patescibacteria group bacterium]